jgi:lysozyme family protein
MSEEPRDSFEGLAKALFHDSVEGLDYALRSRLTQARKAAIEAGSASRPAWFSRIGLLAPAGVTAAAILGAFLWFGSPLSQRAVTVADGQSNFEDLELVASMDESSADALDMLQDDIEFYDWADKVANSGPAA